ncbi:hypothetical protein HY407_03130 [Candidatus Gottesmanbacteria bacterium]|nr:hypothetical protein [Candidatus Gottesmanbacteria bacterium]
MGELLRNILQESPFLLIKIPIIILLLLYISYTFIVMRQTSIMSKIVEIDVSQTVQLLSLIHFLTSLFLLVYALIFL